MKKKLGVVFGVAAAVVLSAVLLTVAAVSVLGRNLVRMDEPAPSDAVVVLFHDTYIYPRMMEAARLYKEGFAPVIVINAGRKLPLVKEMEANGLERQWRWQDEYVPVLEYLGVPGEAVLFLEVPDAFDSRGEASGLGPQLMDLGYRDLIITTNKFHSRRAGYIWERDFGDVFNIRVVPVRDEEFNPSAWWREARQFKWTLYEMGSWVFLISRDLLGIE